jgi:hypothetical protein
MTNACGIVNMRWATRTSGKKLSAVLGAVPYVTLAHPQARSRKNRLRCPISLSRRKLGRHLFGTEVDDDDERKPNAKCGQPTARGKRTGNSSSHDRGNPCVGVLRKPGKGSLHSSRLRKPDQLLHKGEPLAGRVEGS